MGMIKKKSKRGKKMIKRRMLEVRYGSEGPKYDPYSFKEYTMVVNDKKFTLHQGLISWANTNNGERISDMPEKVWSGWAGLTPEQFEKSFQRIRSSQYKYEEDEYKNY